MSAFDGMIRDLFNLPDDPTGVTITNTGVALILSTHVTLITPPHERPFGEART